MFYLANKFYTCTGPRIRWVFWQGFGGKDKDTRRLWLRVCYVGVLGGTPPAILKSTSLPPTMKDIFGSDVLEHTTPRVEIAQWAVQEVYVMQRGLPPLKFEVPQGFPQQSLRIGALSERERVFQVRSQLLFATIHLADANKKARCLGVIMLKRPPNSCNLLNRHQNTLEMQHNVLWGQAHWVLATDWSSIQDRASEPKNNGWISNKFCLAFMLFCVTSELLILPALPPPKTMGPIVLKGTQSCYLWGRFSMTIGSSSITHI